MLKVAVPFRSCDGKRVLVEAESGRAVAVAKRRAAQLAGADPRSELRVVRGRSLVDEGTTLGQLQLGAGEALVLVEVSAFCFFSPFVPTRSTQCVPPPQPSAAPVRAEAATAEDIARATGGQAAAPAARAAPMPAPAAQEVQNRIRGFMESLFANGEGEEASSSGDEAGRGEEEEEEEQRRAEAPEAPEGGAAPPEPDEASVALLTGMGFSANAARKVARQFLDSFVVLFPLRLCSIAAGRRSARWTGFWSTRRTRLSTSPFRPSSWPSCGSRAVPEAPEIVGWRRGGGDAGQWRPTRPLPPG